jgi:hypothetical protein
LSGAPYGERAAVDHHSNHGSGRSWQNICFLTKKRLRETPKTNSARAKAKFHPTERKTSLNEELPDASIVNDPLRSGGRSPDWRP